VVVPSKKKSDNKTTSTTKRKIRKSNDSDVQMEQAQQRKNNNTRTRKSNDSTTSNGPSEGTITNSTLVKRSDDKKKKTSKLQLEQPKTKQSPSEAPAKTIDAPVSYSSLLPPSSVLVDSHGGTETQDGSDPLADGLSSWEEFLGASSSNVNSAGKSSTKSKASPVIKSTSAELPSIRDLFPPNLYAKDGGGSNQTRSVNGKTKSIDGVVPVSDLFYQSDAKTDANVGDEAAVDIAGAKVSYRVEPLSVGVRSRRKFDKPAKSGTDPTANKRRKMVRRGIEMIVGGVTINADPPQWSFELYYDANSDDWASAITLNTKEFGPMLNVETASKLSPIERGLFCEYFVHAALKWDICPKDLRDIVELHLLQPTSTGVVSPVSGMKGITTSSTRPITSTKLGRNLYNQGHGLQGAKGEVRSVDFEELIFMQAKKLFSLPLFGVMQPKSAHQENPPKGFGKQQYENEEIIIPWSTTVSVTVEELGSGNITDGRRPIDNVLMKAFLVANGVDAMKGFWVETSKLDLIDRGDGTTSITVKLIVRNTRRMSSSELTRRRRRIQNWFKKTVDNGLFIFFVAGAAAMEEGWSEEVRTRISEELLLGDDDLEDTSDKFFDADDNDAIDLQPRVKGKTKDQDKRRWSNSSLIDGIFSDISSSNIHNAPFKGELGPFLLEMVVLRAMVHPPKVITIGDVHGCIDELQDLLRQCDYRPGDLVVFLGDLVCKGPDSMAVVQMAREIGAIAIRGNHDFEVIRWHHAIKSGVDPPFAGSEHFHIAACLSRADTKWLYNQPWFISSNELKALFVHAGFVSGIKLPKQNPRYVHLV
jgi:hypothetical protein